MACLTILWVGREGPREGQAQFRSTAWFRAFVRRINGSRSGTLPCHSRLPVRFLSNTLDVSLMITSVSHLPNDFPQRQQEKNVMRSILGRTAELDFSS